MASARFGRVVDGLTDAVPARIGVLTDGRLRPVGAAGVDANDRYVFRHLVVRDKKLFFSPGYGHIALKVSLKFTCYRLAQKARSVAIRTIVELLTHLIFG